MIWVSLFIASLLGFFIYRIHQRIKTYEIAQELIWKVLSAQSAHEAYTEDMLNKLAKDIAEVQDDSSILHKKIGIRKQ